MKRYIVVLLLLVRALGAQHKNEYDTMNWLNTIIDDSHKTSFSTYYQEFLAKQKKLSALARKRNMQSMESLGRAMIHVKHEDLLKKIAFLPEKKQRLFFTRCGAYDQFLRQQIIDKTTTWQKIRSYVWSTKNRITKWFDLLTHRVA